MEQRETHDLVAHSMISGRDRDRTPSPLGVNLQRRRFHGDSQDGHNMHRYTVVGGEVDGGLVVVLVV